VRCLDLFARETCSCIDETQLIAKWIGAVEAFFSPRLCLYRPRDGAFRLITHPPEVFLKIVYRKIDMLRIRLRIPRITISTRIETGEDALTTTKVVPPGRDASPRCIQDGGVVGSRLIDVCNRQNNAEEFS
jgi:hypothetical protein